MAFVGREAVDRSADGGPERVSGAGGDLPEQRLELGEGVLDGVEVGAERILRMANSTGSLVLATAQTAIGSNFLLCDQYMSLVMTGRMYADAYRERGLAPENLSRVTEDAGTVTDPLVPWGSGGAYQTATLGVATIAYFPFAFFCWISPLVTILYGYTGWTIKPLAAEKADALRSQPAE